VAEKNAEVNNSTAYFAGILYIFLDQSLTTSSRGLATCSVSAPPEIVCMQPPSWLQEVSLASINTELL